MTKIVMYEYLGTNGTILSPIHLEDIYYVRKLQLLADNNKRLTKNGKDFVQNVIIPEEELNQWKEVQLGSSSHLIYNFFEKQREEINSLLSIRKNYFRKEGFLVYDYKI